MRPDLDLRVLLMVGEQKVYRMFFREDGKKEVQVEADFDGAIT